MIATIELKDEVNCKIHGLSTTTRRKLNDKFSFILPHAYHVPAFKMGRWDGKKNFFTFGAMTYSNLLEDILPILVDEGYKVNVTDNRTSYQFDLPQIKEDHFSDRNWPEGHPAAGQPVVLRDYQVEIVNQFMANHTGVQVVATGAGKTLVTAALSQMVERACQGEQEVLHKLATGNNGGRSIVIVPNKGLVTQTEEDYVNLGLDVGVYFGDRKDLGKQHTICTWQSLESMQKRFKNGDADLSLDEFCKGVICVIVDETHQAKADVLEKLLTGAFSHIPLRWGLTGTLPKDDISRMSIKCSIGPTLGDGLAASQLQDEGVLSNCFIDVLQLQDAVFYDNYQSELTYLTTDDARLDYIAGMILEMAKAGNTLVLVDRVKCGQGLVDRLPKDRTVLVSGAMKNDNRREHYAEIADNDDKIIIATYGVAAVGINVPRIFNMALIEPGKSFVRVIQSIGRGLRKAQDKDFVNVYDICSSAKFSKRHLTSRKKYYKEAQYSYKISKIDWKKDTGLAARFKKNRNMKVK